MPAPVITPMYIPIETSSCSEWFQLQMATCKTYSTQEEVRACLKDIPSEIWMDIAVFIFAVIIFCVGFAVGRATAE